MKEKVRFLGLDVHAETIAVAVAEPDGEVRSLGTIANREESIRKLVKKLGAPEHLRACYEAGPTGYVLYWQLTQLGVECTVVAPTLVPTKAGDRVRLINRRSNLPRLLLALSSKKETNNDNDKNNPTHGQRLTGSLHISGVSALATDGDRLSG